MLGELSMRRPRRGRLEEDAARTARTASASTTASAAPCLVASAYLGGGRGPPKRSLLEREGGTAACRARCGGKKPSTAGLGRGDGDSALCAGAGGAVCRQLTRR